MLSMAKTKEVVRNGLLDLHGEKLATDGFTHDEIAVSAIAHHETYMKWRGRARGVLGRVGLNLSEKPTRAPRSFRMPTVSAGLMKLKESGELERRHTGDIITSESRDGTATFNFSNSTILYNLTPEAIAMATGRIAPETTASRNGNGAMPVAEAPQALLDDVRSTSS